MKTLVLLALLRAGELPADAPVERQLTPQQCFEEQEKELITRDNYTVVAVVVSASVSVAVGIALGYMLTTHIRLKR